VIVIDYLTLLHEKTPTSNIKTYPDVDLWSSGQPPKSESE